MEKLWTTAEVAKYLGIAELDVEELVRQGQLTGYKLGGQFLRFRPDQVEALKGKLRFRTHSNAAMMRRRDPWLTRFSDFVYFYDFYLISVAFLVVLVIYLVVSASS